MCLFRPVGEAHHPPKRPPRPVGSACIQAQRAECEWYEGGITFYNYLWAGGRFVVAPSSSPIITLDLVRRYSF